MPKLRFLGRENDPIFQVWFGAFVQELALLGWSIGHNVRVDARWATSNAADIRRHATELVALILDVILAYGASTVAPELQVTRAGPIVFPVVGDPVSAGFVDSLARPGGNVTGFMTSDPAQGKFSKTGDFDVNGEESGSEVFRSPFSRAQRVLQCNNRLAYAAASSAKRINLHCRMQHFILIPDIRLDAAGSVAEQSKRKRHPRR